VQIRTRFCVSLDGRATRPDRLPVQLADPSFVPGRSHRFPEFQQACEAVVMGRNTFEPALGADRWPWPDLDVFVLASERPAGTPEEVVVESDPARLLERMRAANRGGDVHLVGGLRTIKTFSTAGALDTLGLLILPIVVGDGVPFADALDPALDLTLTRAEALPEGAVEVEYSVA
jgi:dihydrofolate reductase